MYSQRSDRVIFLQDWLPGASLARKAALTYNNELDRFPHRSDIDAMTGHRTYFINI
jgi:hypothetical protein